jgi:hypothetical protein
MNIFNDIQKQKAQQILENPLARIAHFYRVRYATCAAYGATTQVKLRVTLIIR